MAPSPAKHKRKSAKSKKPNNTKKKTKSRVAEEYQYYEVKRILQEKKDENGNLLYLLEWEGIDPKTGETYIPTWESGQNCNDLLLQDWERKKAGLAANEEGEALPENEEASVEERTTKRKRVTTELSISSSHSDSSPFKKPRKVGTAESARYQSVSKGVGVAGRTGGFPEEIKDSYQEDLPITQEDPLLEAQGLDEQSAEPHGLAVENREVEEHLEEQRAVVEIQVPQGFDREAYSRPALTSSQVSEGYFGGKDRATVQDSQELPDSNSYRPTQTETQTSGPGTQEIDRLTRIEPEPELTAGFPPTQISSRLPTQHQHSSPLLIQASLSFVPSTQDFASTAESFVTGQAFTTENHDSGDNFLFSSSTRQKESGSPHNSRSQIVGSDLRFSQEQRVALPAPRSSTPEGQILSQASLTSTRPRAQSSEQQYYWPRTESSAQRSPPSGAQSSGQRFSASIPPESPPPRPFSANSMSERTQIEPDASDPRSRFKKMYAERNAAKAKARLLSEAAEAAESLSPSPAPQVAMIHALASNSMLPVFESPPSPTFKSLNDAEAPSPRAFSDSDIENYPVLAIQSITEGEYVVPLPMNASVRALYLETLKNAKTERVRFLCDDVFDTDLVQAIDAMILNLLQLCDHQSLVERDYASQRAEPATIQARYAENISTKCIFLAEFLKDMRDSQNHIVILVSPGRMLEILEAICQCYDYTYTRADQPGWSGSRNNLMKITLFPTEGDNYIIEPASIVIAFDSTAASSSHLTEVRHNPSLPTSLAPTIHLVITKSIEHLVKCFPTDTEAVQRKIWTVAALVHLMEDNQVGMPLQGLPDPAEAANLVAAFCSNAIDSWPIPRMPAIEGIKLRNWPEHGSPAAAADGFDFVQRSYPSAKRGLESVESSSSSTKRQRMIPSQGHFGDSRTMSHITDTVLPSSLQVNVSGVSNDEHVALLERISKLELQLRTKEESEKTLLTRAETAEAKVQDLESSNDFIIPAYQTALNDRGEFEYQANKSAQAEAQALKQLAAKDQKISDLKDRLEALEADLLWANSALKEHQVPDVAEMQRMREECNRLIGENKAVDHRWKEGQKQLDYIRSQYQDARFKATEATAEAQELREQNEKLSRKADDNLRIIREVQKKNDTKFYLNTIQSLKDQNAMLKTDLDRRDAELKAFIGRRPTRGSSVPQSPRIGTMSPAVGRAIQMANQISRGTSPAPGDFGASTLAGPLFASPGGPSARRSHLQ